MDTTTIARPKKYSDFTNSDLNDWCPGCGDNGIRTSIAKSIINLSNDPAYKKTVAFFSEGAGGTSMSLAASDNGEAEDIAVKAGFEKKEVEFGLNSSDVLFCTGIGCSAKITNQMQKLYTFHSLHGRAVAVAQAIKLANWDLEVIVGLGDGDGLGIGGNHFFHAGRKNIDITLIIFDNQVYGLTKGQQSPTMLKNMKTKSMAAPATKEGVNPLAASISTHCTYVGQSYSNSVNHLVGMLTQAMKHKGTSVVNVLQTCPTYNDVFTDKFFKTRLRDISELNSTFDPVVLKDEDRIHKTAEAYEMALKGYMRVNPEDGERENFIGLYYHDKTSVPLEIDWVKKVGPVALAKRDITDPARKDTVRNLMAGYQRI